MGTINIVLYLFGTIFFLSALAFAFFAFSNARLMRGPLGHQAMAMGAGFFIVAAIIGAVDHFFFPGSGLVYAEFSIWVTGLWMIVGGGVLRAKDIQRVNRMPILRIFTVIPYAKIYTLGITSLLLISMPISLLSVLSPLRAEAKWFNVVNMIIWAFAFAVMAASERRFYLAVRPLAAIPAVGIVAEEEMLLRDDLLVLRAYADLAGRLAKAIRPMTGAGPLRDVLNRCAEEHTLLKDCEMTQEGALVVTRVAENLTSISEHEGLARVFNGCSRLISELINLYSAVASPDLAKEMMALSFQATKARYGDIPGFLLILEAIPQGFLEEEKLALLSKEELEAKVKERTKELELALIRAAQATEALQASRVSFHNIVERNTDGIVVVDHKGVVRFVNPAARSILGPTAEQLMYELFGSCVNTNGVREIDVIRQGEEKGTVELRMVETEWEGETAYLALLRDITERKQAEKQLKASLGEKEVLLKEIHHRVKNNLQIICSLLNLQTAYIEDTKTLEIFRDSQSRVRSMALIHEKLYQSQDLSRVNLVEYIHNLTTYLFRAHGDNARTVTLNIQADDVYLGIDAAVPFGLLLNELVSNALKHAFPNGRTGEIRIELGLDSDQRVTLVIRDDGIGFPGELDFHNTKSLGLQLVNALTKQLNGTIEMHRNDGTEFEITFSENAPDHRPQI